MTKLIRAARWLSLALVLVVAVATLSPVQQASAMSRAEMAYICDIYGGIYYETYLYGEVFEYGCLTLEGGEMYCFGIDDCGFIPPPLEDNRGDPWPSSSQPPGGELVDQNSDAPLPPTTDGSHSGFETKMAGQ